MSAGEPEERAGQNELSGRGRGGGGGGGAENPQPPLPEGWDLCRDFDGRVYFIDHNTKQTTWADPRLLEGTAHQLNEEQR